jgi:hypothetical protein
MSKFARLRLSFRSDYSASMKKIYNAAKRKKHGIPQNGYFRRLVRHLFLSWIKRQNSNYLDEIEKIVGKLGDIEESIEIIAREIARQAKRIKK